MRVVEAGMVCVYVFLYAPLSNHAIQDAEDVGASMTSYLLEEAQIKGWSDERKAIKDVAGVSYAGSSFTYTL